MIPIQNPALFWDVHPEDIHPIEHKKWLIERVTQWGNLSDIRALLHLYSFQEIRTIVASSRSVDAKTKAFWLSMRSEEKMHEEVLPERTRYVWDTVTQVSNEFGFTLVGGTALALRLGHRQSEDLDFFRAENFETSPIINLLNQNMDESSVLEIVAQEPENTLHLRFNGVKLSFLYQAGQHLSSFEEWRGVRIASIDSIIAMKLNAVAGRGDRKDFIDLYAICQEVYGFQEMLERGFKLLPNLNQYHVLRSLVYFDDAEASPPLRLFREYSWTEVKRFFEMQVKRVLA